MDQILVVYSTGGNLFQRGRTAMAMERFPNFNDEVKRGRRSVRLEEERVERSAWLDREQLTKIGGLRGLKCVVGE